MLTQQSASRARTGEELEAFGKQAAAHFSAGRGTLTEMVVSTVKHAGLSPEQVRRVVEFANHSAYTTEFAKESSAHKVVNFRGGPADPAAVLQDLNDGGGGSVFDSGLGDYRLPPPNLMKTAERNERLLGIEDAKLAEAFGLTEEFLAPYASPMAPALDERDKLAGMHANAQYELGGEESRYLDICDVLTSEVKLATRRGTPLSHVVAAWGEVNANPEFIKAAFDMLADRLPAQGVFPSRAAMAESLSVKIANVGLVNPDHPLVLTYRDFCESLSKMAALRQVGEECIEGVEALNAFVLDLSKESSAASAVGEAGGGLLRQIPKAWRTATEATARASGPTRDVVTELLSGAGASEGLARGAGNVVGGAVKYAPHIGAGLVAEEGYQRARYNPAVQGAKNFVLSRVPYTQPWLVRQYSLQQGLGF
jgi:hypothetical protein